MWDKDLGLKGAPPANRNPLISKDLRRLSPTGRVEVMEIVSEISIHKEKRWRNRLDFADI